MKLGFFTMPIHPLDKDWRLSLKEDREAFLLADELGFTEAYVGEHVTDKAENITSCVAFIAWIRPEMTFDTVADLVRRMDEDCRLARNALKRAGDVFPPLGPRVSPRRRRRRPARGRIRGAGRAGGNGRAPAQ